MPPLIPSRAWHAAADLPDRPTPADLASARRRAPELSAADWSVCVEQTLLRRRATATFGSVAGTWWVTDQGLQQASHPAVAGRRAQLLAEQGETAFTDLGCGLGIDSWAAQRSGLTVTAVDSDARTADYASHNLGIQVRHGDARDEVLAAGAVAFVDPARRRGHDVNGIARRSVDPESWHPPWSWVRGLVHRHPRTVVKAAPGLAHDLLPPGAAAEWVSVDGRLVETTVWGTGVRGERPRRCATRLTTGPDPWAASAASLGSDNPETPAPAGPLGTWLLEPDPAVIRSHLLTQLCALTRTHLVSEGIAYLTTASDSPPDPTWGRVSRVVDVLPPRAKALRAELRRRGVGHVEIRTRGLNLDPASLRRELRLPGGPPGADLVLTRLQGRAAAVLVSD